MSQPQVAPFGSWKSPITSDLIVAETVGLGQIVLDGGDIYWTEMRPAEAGRYVIVRRSADGETTDVTPAGFNARTRVHEYGGGAFAVCEGVIYFSNFADQRLYHQRPGEDPAVWTPAAEMRYADGVIDGARQRMICVREDHTAEDREAVNTLVGLNLAGGHAGEILAAGCDFYSSPRISPDGSQLAWLQWNHPNMPWDGTELCVADVNINGTLGEARKVAGGLEESILQPEWSPDGVLHFISDKSGWWNVYRLADGGSEPIGPKEAEFGGPAWLFGMCWYAFESAESLVCTYTESGGQRLARLDTNTLALTEIKTPFATVSGIKIASGQAVFIAGSPTTPTAVARLNLASGETEILKQSSNVEIDASYISVPEPITFPTENDERAHAYYYAPKNQDFTAANDERPPLLVKSHGGPTGATSANFNPTIQYWTSRGFAVLDVNYRGSTGYGRAYRNRLRGQWGVVDVDDCCNGAKFLVEQGHADASRLAIAGGSAGGYTTLCALTYRDIFKAGASHFGLSELTVFVDDTHKFESRYLDSLIGPYPERKDLYEARSPVNFVDSLSCPVIFFQGDEDKIVPPNQAELMVAALREKGLPVAYVLFADEQHGFRQSQNIKRALDGEFYFYSRVFGFTPAETIDPVEIDNL